MKLIGPFTQLLTLRGLPLKGALQDEQLEIISGGGILSESGKIVQVGPFDQLLSLTKEVEEIV